MWKTCFLCIAQYFIVIGVDNIYPVWAQEHAVVHQPKTITLALHVFIFNKDVQPVKVNLP